MRSQKQYLMAPNIWNVLIYRVHVSFMHECLFYDGHMTCLIPMFTVMFYTNSKYVKKKVSENMELQAYHHIWQ